MEDSMAPEVLKILAVDDLPDNLITLKAVLRDALPAARVLTAASGPAGIALARAEDPDVILLDIIMPEMDGFAVCRALKADERTAGIPVVFLTALRGDRKNRVEALEAGAEGFLAKPLDEIELVAQIRAMTKIKAANRAQQSERERLAALVAERTSALEQELAERKRAEEHLKKYQNIVSSTPDGVAFIDEDYRYTIVNEAYERFSGINREQFVGRTVAEYLGEDVFQRIVKPHFDRCLQGEVVNYQEWFDYPILGRRFVDVSYFPYKDTHNHIAGIISNTRDITERKRAEVALRESEARYRRLTDNARDIIFRYGLVPEMRLTYINPAVEEITGYSPEACYADPDLMLNLAHPEDRPMIAGFMATLSAPDQPFTMRWISKDGGVRWMESRVVPVYDAAGQLVAVEGITRDMTEHKRAEDARQESEARYRAIFENMAAACCVDEVIFENGQAVDYRILDVNPAYERITGIPRSQAANALASELYGTGQAPFLDIYSRVAATGEPAAFEAHFAPIEKDLYITVGSPGPGRFSTVFSDITERKQAEQALRESAAALQKAQAVARVGSWVWHVPTNRLEWSDQMYCIFGIEKTAFTGDLADVMTRAIHPDDRPAVERSNLSVIHNRTPIPLEYRVVWPDGTVRVVWAEAGELLLDAAGNPLALSGIVQDITERKQAEAALRESERRFRHIADTISDIAYSCCADAGGNYTLDWMTGAAEPITGYTAAEIQAHGCWRFLVVDADVARFDQHVAGIAPGASSSCELRLRRKDGEIVWVNSIAECVLDEAHADRRRLYGGLMNITERKQAEAALRERENMLQKIFDILPIGLWFADKDGRLLRGNPAGVAIWGAEPKVAHAEYGVFKARRLPSREEIAPADWALAHTIREGVTVVDELLEIDAFDGKKKTILNYTAPVLDEAGAVLGAIVVNQDVTERVQAETELRRVNHFLDTIIENIPDMIFLKEAAGLRFVRLNRAGENLLGLARAAILGKNDYDFFPQAEADFFIQKDRQALQGKVMVDIPEELIQTQAQGQRRLHTKKVPLLDASGEPEYLLGISEDITERVQAEDRLRATLVELQRANSDLERFVHIASHDLQEPLRMVSSYAQLLRINYRGRLDADADEFIDYLVEGAMRMHQLLLDLLDYSSVNTRWASPQPADAAVSYEMALINLEPLIAQTAATITCDPLPTVLANPEQLTQLLQILIGNGIKFHGDEPPRVHVSARAKDDGRSAMFDGRSAHIEHRPSNIEHRPSEWVFAVRDNGIGIEPQYFERIFIIFQRLHTRRKYQGNGIGLAIGKRIVERHGGRIWVESQPGQGSTFYFTLPAVG
jgi:PAS domain S-box-containing protein